MNYLFHNKYKKIGWIILVPSVIVAYFSLFHEWQPDFLDVKVPAIISDKEGLNFDYKLFKMIENNILNEILGILIIISSLLIAFSKEKQEDEFIAKIRLECLVWATYLNFAILLFAIIAVYGIPFFYVMNFNMFTIPIFFIITFNWQLRKIKNYEK